MKKINSFLGIFVCFAMIALSSCSQSTKAGQSEAVFKTVSMQIEGMTCEMGCKNAIEKKVAKQEGVESISIDFENAVAEIKYDEQITNPEEVIETIESIGGGLYTAKIALAQKQ